MVDIINELTKHSTDSTTNFLKSLQFIDNAFLLADFFMRLENAKIEYHIIKGFDYTEIDNNFSKFKSAYFVCDNENIENYTNRMLDLAKISNFYVLTVI